MRIASFIELVPAILYTCAFIVLVILGVVEEYTDKTFLGGGMLKVLLWAPLLLIYMIIHWIITAKMRKYAKRPEHCANVTTKLKLAGLIQLLPAIVAAVLAVLDFLGGDTKGGLITLAITAALTAVSVPTFDMSHKRMATPPAEGTEE